MGEAHCTLCWTVSAVTLKCGISHTYVSDGFVFFKGVRRRSQKDSQGLYDNGFQKAAFLLLQALQTWKVLRELVMQLQHLSDLQSDMLR